MITAGDLMTKDVISVKKETPIFEALMLLRKHDITGMPVVDDDMIVIGIITEKDALGLCTAISYDRNETVASFMTKPAVSFGEDESLNSVCEILMVKHFRRVPVVSAKGKLVGIISRPDIIDHILLQQQIITVENARYNC